MRAPSAATSSSASTPATPAQFWVVGVIAFTGVFREGAETVLFLWGLLTQIGSQAGSSLLALGGLLGILGAVGLGVLVFQGARQVSLRRFFGWTSVFLLLLAAGLFSTGVGRLQGLGILPSADTLWDTSRWLDDRGFLGRSSPGSSATGRGLPPGRWGRTSPTLPWPGGYSSGFRPAVSLALEPCRLHRPTSGEQRPGLPLVRRRGPLNRTAVPSTSP